MYSIDNDIHVSGWRGVGVEEEEEEVGRMRIWQQRYGTSSQSGQATYGLARPVQCTAISAMCTMVIVTLVTKTGQAIKQCSQCNVRCTKVKGHTCSIVTCYTCMLCTVNSVRE